MSNAESVMQEAIEALQTVRKVRELVGAWGHETTVEAVERFREDSRETQRSLQLRSAECDQIRETLGARNGESALEAAQRATHEREESEHLRRVIYKVREALGAPPSESVVEAAQRVARELGFHDEREAMCAYIFEIRKVLGAKPELTALEAIHDIAQVLHHSEGETLIDAAARVMLERDSLAAEVDHLRRVRETLGGPPHESVVEAARRGWRTARIFI